MTRHITLDLRYRCARPKCSILIRKGAIAQDNWRRYKPYCSFACKEWHNLECAQEYVINQLREKA